jgi:ATP-dependent DNA helicase RecG
LEKEGIQPVFLTKNVTGAERQRVLEQMQNGTCSVIVGTHALIQDALVFHRLGMVVIDEQHRFGVNQRKALREKGGAPDCLFLSATPIPRSLAIALFGDMDISTIKSMPSGRQPIKTTIVGLDEFDSILPDIRQELDKGHQAYMICPLIAESETMDLVSVSEATREIKKVLPKSVSIAMLHGKMKSEEKAKILDDFFQGNTAVLVSTTVVEVGLDCPNATVMIILNAERFGLAQIHQIRGRVGRGHAASSCYLIVNPELEIRDRLGILEKTNDGFQIAEADLDLRGPGEVFGEEQTGIPRFKMANMVRDIQLMEVAFADAKQLIDSPDPLSRVLVHTAISEIQAYFLD